MNGNLFGKTNWKALRFLLLSVVGFIVVLLFFLPDPKSRIRPPIQRSVTNVRGLAQGAVIFAGYRNDCFPSEEEWPSALIELKFIESDMLVSPLDGGTENAYIYVPSQLGPDDLNFEKRIILYENPDHYEEGVVVGFANAWAEIIDHDDFERMLADQLASQDQINHGESP